MNLVRRSPGRAVIGSSIIGLVGAVLVGFAPASVADPGPVSALCAADFASGSEGETCLPALSIRTAGQVPHLDAADFLAIAENAVQQAAVAGDTDVAAAFIEDATDDLSRSAVTALQDAVQEATAEPEQTPETPVLKSRKSRKSARMAPQYGDPRFQTEYVDYWNVRSDGTRHLVSTTRLQFWHYINTDSTDFGKKALSVHIQRASGRDTYYGDAVCKLRRSDTFLDNDVATWGRCQTPDLNSVNDFDLYRTDIDYYGNRGDKYYNKIWWNINPAGAEYSTLRADRSGPKWKNPDGGGAPRWL